MSTCSSYVRYSLAPCALGYVLASFAAFLRGKQEIHLPEELKQLLLELELGLKFALQLDKAPDNERIEAEVSRFEHQNHGCGKNAEQSRAEHRQSGALRSMQERIVH